MGVLLVVSIIVCASCFLITDRWCLQRKVHELYLGSRCNFTYMGKTKKDRHAALKIERKHVFQRKNPFWRSQYEAAIELLWHSAFSSLSVDVTGNEAQW